MAIQGTSGVAYQRFSSVVCVCCVLVQGVNDKDVVEWECLLLFIYLLNKRRVPKSEASVNPTWVFSLPQVDDCDGHHFQAGAKIIISSSGLKLLTTKQLLVISEFHLQSRD